MRRILTIATFVLVCNAAFGCACQNKTAADGTPTFVFPAAVGWAPSFDDAMASAKTKNLPILVYFAAPNDAEVVGESPETIQKFASAHENAIPNSVFDLPKMITHLRAAGVAEVVKVPHVKDNALVVKYQAQPFSYLVLSPSGERIDGGVLLGAGLDKKVGSAKTKIEAWKSTAPTAAK